MLHHSIHTSTSVPNVDKQTVRPTKQTKNHYGRLALQSTYSRSSGLKSVNQSRQKKKYRVCPGQRLKTKTRLDWIHHVLGRNFLLVIILTECLRGSRLQQSKLPWYQRRLTEGSITRLLEITRLLKSLGRASVIFSEHSTNVSPTDYLNMQKTDSIACT